MRGPAAVLVALLVWSPASAQSVLERSPNLQGVWGLPAGHPAFVLAHRFELISGGDELFSVPTLTLAVGLPFGTTAGVDFTSFSEAIPERLLGNESQYWLKRPFALGPVRLAALGAYNTGARSYDGAVDFAAGHARVRVFGEGRVFSSLFGSGRGGAAGALGAALHLTEHLVITGDLGRVLTEDTVGAAWSAAVAVSIPASPHTLALQISNGGATTLQGASRPKTVGNADIRYGFTFTIPLGGRARWASIFRPVQVDPASTSADTLVRISGLAYEPAEIRIRAGETVEWLNLDPVVHTVTGSGGDWGSGDLAPGARYSQTFENPGRFTYICLPHPMMTGIVVVEP